MAKTLSRTEFLAVLSALIEKHGTQRAAAAALGISQSLLNDVMHGRRSGGPKLLRAMGYAEEPHYRKIAS